MAAGFLTKRILVVRETTPGVIPTNPVCLEFLAETFGLKEVQASEQINLLGSGGDASPLAFGGSDFNGAVGIVASVDNIPVVMTHIAGLPLSTANATSDAYPVIATVVTVGDMFNHSDGKHTLTCIEAGTTSGTEPTLNANPNLDRNKKVTDGTAVFIANPLLKTYTFERKQQLPTFTIEYEMENAEGEEFYKRFSKVYMNALPVAMAGDTISLKVSGDFMAAVANDSTSATWDEELSAKTGAKIIPMFKNFYTYEDCTVKKDDVAFCEVQTINMDISRNVTIQKALNRCKIADVGAVTASGAMTAVFKIADYENNKNHTDFKLSFEFRKDNGCQFILNFPLVKPSQSDPDQTFDKQAMMTSTLSAYGESGTQSFNATVIAPALIDSTGAVIGTY